jgi:hypothetical protein
VATDSGGSKPANEGEVITDFIRPFSEKQALQLPPPKTRSSSCEPFREIIELGLSRDRNAMAIWQDLVTGHGFSGAYNTVKRFVRQLRGVRKPQASGIIITAPGEEAQVDYGTGPMVRDPESGKYRRTRLFVMTLGCSRKSVRLLVFRSEFTVVFQSIVATGMTMGNEAKGAVRDGKNRYQGKILLETSELIFRCPDYRLKIAFSEIRSVKVVEGELRVETSAGAKIFEVGEAAEKWREKILHPKSRVEKLGIKEGTPVRIVGEDEVGEDRAFGRMIFSVLRIIDQRADDRTFDGANAADDHDKDDIRGPVHAESRIWRYAQVG